MPQFRTREEYDRWKAGRGGAPTAPPASAPAKGPVRPGFSIAKTKPRRGLVVAGAVVLGGIGAYMLLTGEIFSGLFVLGLGVLIAGAYYFYRYLHPELDDAEYLKTMVGAAAMTALRHGRVSEGTVEAVKRAEEEARQRYQAEQGKRG